MNINTSKNCENKHAVTPRYHRPSTGKHRFPVSFRVAVEAREYHCSSFARHLRANKTIKKHDKHCLSTNTTTTSLHPSLFYRVFSFSAFAQLGGPPRHPGAVYLVAGGGATRHHTAPSHRCVPVARRCISFWDYHHPSSPMAVITSVTCDGTLSIFDFFL